MSSLDSVREDFYNRFLDTRNLVNLINSKLFDYVYSKSTPKEQEKIRELCDGCVGSDKTMRNICQEALQRQIKNRDLNTNELRTKARLVGIRQYSRLSKAELLSELSKHGTRTLCGSNIRNNESNQDAPT